MSHAALALRRAGKTTQLVLRINGVDKLGREVPDDINRLRVEVADGGLCTFSFANGGGFTPLPIRFQATKGVWIGAKVGLYSLTPDNRKKRGYLDCEYFKFLPPTGQVEDCSP